jgi:hypothetical protein
MDQSYFGFLALAFNALSFLSVVALAGQETLIVRSWMNIEFQGARRWRPAYSPSVAMGLLHDQLGLGQHQASLRHSLGFQRIEPFVHRLEVVPLPHAAHDAR